MPGPAGVSIGEVEIERGFPSVDLWPNGTVPGS